jgi:Tol biopolymer transport system component
LTRTRTWFVILTSIGVTGSVFVSSGPVTAAFPGANGKIAFESNRDGNSEIYSMNPDGSSQTRLTNNSFLDTEPTWSPNGTRIAFTSDRDGNEEIYVMNADGSGQTRLTTNSSEDDDPAWSPDGARIAFTSDRDGNFEIYAMNADGTGQTRLTTNSDVDGSPAWSPDGTKITFQRTSGTDFDIWVMNADSTGQTLLNATGDDFGTEPAWSPDGTKIVYGHFENSVGNTEIWVMNADGSGPTNLTNNPSGEREPDWQPIPQGPGSTAPETTILKGPKKKTTDRTPTFTFESNVNGATFECKLDAKPFAACTSPKKYKKQGYGRHTFQVRAIAGGVTDATPATKRWKVVEN